MSAAAWAALAAWLGLAGTWVAMWRRRGEASDALIRAKAAEARAEEALQMAANAANALQGLHEVERARDRARDLDERAMIVARRWLTNALQSDEASLIRVYTDLSVPIDSVLHQQVAIETEIHARAAQLLASLPGVRRTEPEAPRLGDKFTFDVSVL